MDREIHANNDGHRRERFYNLCQGPEPGSHMGTDEVISQKSEAQGDGLCPIPYLFLEHGTYQGCVHLGMRLKALEAIDSLAQRHIANTWGGERVKTYLVDIPPARSKATPPHPQGRARYS